MSVNVTAPLLSPSYLYNKKSIRVMSHAGVILHFQVPKGEMKIVRMWRWSWCCCRISDTAAEEEAIPCQGDRQLKADRDGI